MTQGRPGSLVQPPCWSMRLLGRKLQSENPMQAVDAGHLHLSPILNSEWLCPATTGSPTCPPSGTTSTSAHNWFSRCDATLRYMVRDHWRETRASTSIHDNTNQAV